MPEILYKTRIFMQIHTSTFVYKQFITVIYIFQYFHLLKQTARKEKYSHSWKVHFKNQLNSKRLTMSRTLTGYSTHNGWKHSKNTTSHSLIIITIPRRCSWVSFSFKILCMLISLGAKWEISHELSVPNEVKATNFNLLRNTYSYN